MIARLVIMFMLLALIFFCGFQALAHTRFTPERLAVITKNGLMALASIVLAALVVAAIFAADNL